MLRSFMFMERGFSRPDAGGRAVAIVIERADEQPAALAVRTGAIETTTSGEQVVCRAELSPAMQVAARLQGMA